MMDMSAVKAMLQQDGYLDAGKLIESLENTISRKAEYQYLKAFARESSFDDELCRDQLRSLWTAYCFHQELTVDTAGYDNDLLELWNFMVNCGYPLSRWWSTFEDFDAFMCRHLV